MCILSVLLVYFLGAPQDVKSRRNPRLVPYDLLDERTKKSNRDSLREAIRTLVGYGYDIDPPDQEGGDMMCLCHTVIAITQILFTLYYLVVCVIFLTAESLISGFVYHLSL